MKPRTTMVHRHRRPFRSAGKADVTATGWEKAITRLEGAYSPHTLRGYRTDFGSFANWCAAHDQVALPTTPLVVASYLAAETARLKPSTLKRKLAGIRKIHRLHEHRDPTDHFEVDLALRRARRLKPQRPKQALGITASLRDQLMAACNDDLTGLRDRALIAVGFDTLCRRGEIVALQAEDLEPNHFGALSILVRRAKNDPEGTGRIAHLSSPTVKVVEAWLSAARITSGPLFRPIYCNIPIDRHLTPMTVTRVLKKLAASAQLDATTVEKISGHSLRVGAAQQLVMNGVQLLPIMRAGGWRSMNIVARYIENVDVNVWG
ncbi:MAG: tyrosine-type recombinase/integrase [Devosia sp.]